MPIDGEPTDIDASPNVQNIKSYIPDSAAWDAMFPKRADLYTYESFLKAAAKYPAFCNENNISSNTVKQTCGRELATFFAHLTQETGYNHSSISIPTW